MSTERKPAVGVIACGKCEAHGNRWAVPADDPDMPGLFYTHLRQEHSVWKTILWWAGFRT